ncbi:MAG TPA: SMI1/KNR4 family protein [Lacipirellulaceae bacterium]|nr:SMI1/KNR4 family protein [Lacipirellulaceae bacterium]
MKAILDRLVERWRIDGVEIPAPVDQRMIEKFESENEVRFPADMRAYFLTVNGMGTRGESDQHFFCFWPLEDVQSIAKYTTNVSYLQRGPSDYFLFADHSIDVVSFAIHLSNDQAIWTPVVRTYWKDDDLETVCDSFTDFLKVYLADPFKCM